MNNIEFIIFIESIGFESKNNPYYYYYKQYIINTYFISTYSYYSFHNESGWGEYDCGYLAPLHKEFKKELRSIKLKNLLSL